MLFLVKNVFAASQTPATKVLNNVISSYIISYHIISLSFCCLPLVLVFELLDRAGQRLRRSTHMMGYEQDKIRYNKISSIAIYSSPTRRHLPLPYSLLQQQDMFFSHKKTSPMTIYVKDRIYRPHLAKTINLKQFRMKNDRKNGAVLTIILPARFEKHINYKNVIFSKSFFLKNVFPQIHFTSCSGRGSGRCRLYIYIYTYIYIYIYT